MLQQLSGRPRAQNELARLLRRRPQAVAKSLRILEGLGLVESIEERDHAARNAPARRWGLTEAGHTVVDEGISADVGPSSTGDADGNDRSGHPTFALKPHQSFVAAPLKSNELPSFLDALADGELAAEASFVARIDGETHGYVFLFERPLGARPTEKLAAALDAARLQFTAGVVADVRTVDELVRDARAARAAGARMRRGDPDPT